MRGKVTREKFIKIKANLKPGTKVKILTGSMSPFISVGEIITISPFKKEELKEFDTLVFFQGDKLICHFFYKTEKVENKTIYYTKALNGKKLDHPFAEEDILGVVTSPELPSWKRFFMRLLF